MCTFPEPAFSEAPGETPQNDRIQNHHLHHDGPNSSREALTACFLSCQEYTQERLQNFKNCERIGKEGNRDASHLEKNKSSAPSNPTALISINTASSLNCWSLCLVGD